MSKNSLKDYWEALERIKKKRPQIVTPGGRITNDQVSLEAGRNRGSIKKSRTNYVKLIVAIEDAEEERLQSNNKDEEKYQRRRSEAQMFKLLYQQSVAREISLAKENKELKQEIKQFESNNVYSLKQ